MAFPFVCYNNIIRIVGAGGSIPTPATGYDSADIYDFKPHTFWKSNVLTSPQDFIMDLGGAAQGADYIALINHNMADSPNYDVTVYADTFTPPTTVRVAAYTPASNVIDLTLFTSPGSFRYWMVRLTNSAAPWTSAPFIGELMLGLRTTFTEYLSPTVDPYFTDVEVIGSRSIGGNYLGATERGKRHRGVIEFGPAGIARSEFTNTLNPFIETHAQRRRPFLFVVDSADTDFDTPFYVRVPDNASITRKAVGGSWGRMTLSIPVEEAYMEPVV